MGLSVTHKCCTLALSTCCAYEIVYIHYFGLCFLYFFSYIVYYILDGVGIHTHKRTRAPAFWTYVSVGFPP